LSQEPVLEPDRVQEPGPVPERVQEQEPGPVLVPEPEGEESFRNWLCRCNPYLR